MFRLSLTLIAALWAGLMVWGAPIDVETSCGQAAPLSTPIIARVVVYPTPTILSDNAFTTAKSSTRAAPPAVLAAVARAPQDSALPPAAAEELPLFTVTGTQVNMRAGPSTDTSIVMSLSLGSITEGLGPAQGGWIEIRDLNTGITGFMSARFLELL